MSTDHKAEAEQAAAAGQYGVAQFHASMHLIELSTATVEQQKLANQMAYMESLATVERDGYVLNQEGREDMASLHVLIREGLALA